MIDLIGDRAMNKVISHLEGVRASVREHADVIAGKAEANLAAARAASVAKGNRPHGTSISVESGAVDSYVELHGDNAMAIEFGHRPSGWFEGTNTKAPAGLYILTRAAHG